jgi:hypothetical protein
VAAHLTTIDVEPSASSLDEALGDPAPVAA